MSTDDTMSQKRTTAIHEAGHAVSQLRMGFGQGEVSIIPNEEEARWGRAVGEGPQHCWNEEQARGMLIGLCAGYGAVKANGYTDEDAESGCCDDFEKAEEMARFWFPGSKLEQWKQEAVEFISRPDNLRAVVLVAAELERRGVLEGEHAEILIELADGACTDEDYRSWLTMSGLQVA